MSAIWHGKPAFPACDLNRGTVRYRVSAAGARAVPADSAAVEEPAAGEYFVDWNEPGTPTYVGVEAVLERSRLHGRIAEAEERAGLSRAERDLAIAALPEGHPVRVKAEAVELELAPLRAQLSRGA